MDWYAVIGALPTLVAGVWGYIEISKAWRPSTELRRARAEQRSLELEAEAGLVFDAEGFLQPGYSYLTTNPAAPKPVIHHKRVVRRPSTLVGKRAQAIRAQMYGKPLPSKTYGAEYKYKEPKYPERRDPTAFGKATRIPSKRVWIQQGRTYYNEPWENNEPWEE